MRYSKCKIVSISSVSGGGKTSITKELNRITPNSKALYFDDYDSDGPSSITQWVEEGSDYNLWNLNVMIQAINDILVNKNDPVEYLFLDYPFSRMHDEMAKYINYSIFIDTPLDVAMARRIRRDYTESNLQDLIEDLEDYVSKGRKGYEEMLRTIKPDSDFVIDGTVELNRIAVEINKIIEKKYV